MKLTLIPSDVVNALTRIADNRHTASVDQRFIDVTITSPPYNIGLKYHDGVKDKMTRQAYIEFSQAWLPRLLRLTKTDGHLFLNVGSLGANPMLPFDIVEAAAWAGWKLQNTFHWIKSISFKDKKEEWVSRGQFKPINSERFVNNLHEYVFHLTPEGTSYIDRLAVGVPYQDKTNIARWAGKRDKRCLGNVWLLPYETINSREKQRPHPATFPVALAEQCLKLVGQHRTVCDPFVGSGTTAEAAFNLKEADEFIGIDLSSTYISWTRERLEALQSK